MRETLVRETLLRETLLREIPAEVCATHSALAINSNTISAFVHSDSSTQRVSILLNPCDFFLWGYLKDRIYRIEPTTVDDLKEKIEQ